MWLLIIPCEGSVIHYLFVVTMQKYVKAFIFYRNDIYNSGDDCTEVDHAFRNVTFYDNRCTNSGTLISLDPLYGGPFIAARNIGINISRRPT